MDSPNGSNEWPSDLADQVAQLNRDTGQSASHHFDISALQGLPTATLTEAQMQMLAQPGCNFSFLQLPTISTVQNNAAIDNGQLQAPDIHSFTETLQQQLQGLSKELSGWSPSISKDGENTSTQSTLILNIDGTSQEIPISFQLDSSASIGHTAQTEDGIDSLQKTYNELEQAAGNVDIKVEEQQNSHPGQIFPHIRVTQVPVEDASVKNNVETPNTLIVNIPTLVPKEDTADEYEECSIDCKVHTHSVLKPQGEQEIIRENNERDFKPVGTEKILSSVLNSPEVANEVVSGQTIFGVSLESKVRKSTRLAKQIDEIIKKVTPNYTAQAEYNPSQMWCDDCQSCYKEECPYHQVQPMYDKVVLSRAWASLPATLQIFRLGESTELGVFCKKFIAKRTQFGPFIGDMSEDKVVFDNAKFPVSVDVTEGIRYIEATDENKCNWMMFVRPAESYREQNLVAFQYQDEIFFNSIREIQPKEELKVWYAAHYGHSLGIKPHPKIIEPTEDEGKFECSECNRKLKSAALLEKHIFEVHDQENANADASRIKPEPSIADEKELETTSSGSSFQSWKKRKRNLYFNKIKKYKELKTRAEAKRKGASECWKCLHCLFTFDNSTLLNIHTLAHAAEAALEMEQQRDGNDALSQLSAAAALICSEAEQQKTFAENGLDVVNDIKCPCCDVRFKDTNDLIQHTVVHGKKRKMRTTRKNRIFNPAKPFQCPGCIKTFPTDDRLQRHRLVHSLDDSHKPLTCDVCHKKFMTNPALACHKKIHSSEKYYTCPICREGFDHLHAMKIHGKTHAVNGVYPCTHCHKTFYDFNPLRKHIRTYHPYKELPCPYCDKIFPRSDKLKLHMLKHSNHKEYMCDQCGRQFKRKDKLKEHAKRMHDPANPKTLRQYNTENVPKVKFIPKVLPTDYERFIYKCHNCMLGFKRRGMLVNHLNKRHPGVTPESIPELNLPILRTQRDFFCQYCDKVYKSSSKRKAHIMKSHPGAELPPSGRARGPEYEGIMNNYGINTTTYSQLTGSIAATPHSCDYCHKQYASKPKLLQHQRKEHPSCAQPKKSNARPNTVRDKLDRQRAASAEKEIEVPIEATFVVQQQEGQTADILTQAMSELTQSFTGEYRGGTPQNSAQIQHQVAELQLTPTGGRVTNSGVLLQPLLQTAVGTATIDIGPFLQEVSSQEDGVGGDQNMQQITIVHGNQSQTISVPMSLATQLISRSFVQTTTSK